jgi:hypothetical protein
MGIPVQWKAKGKKNIGATKPVVCIHSYIKQGLGVPVKPWQVALRIAGRQHIIAVAGFFCKLVVCL